MDGCGKVGGPTPRSPDAVRSAASPTSQPLLRPDVMARSAATPTPRSPAAPSSTLSSPAPDASILEPRRPPPPTGIEDVEENWRAIKIEKATGPGHEEHNDDGELHHMESSKSKKRKRSRKRSGELHGEHQEMNKVVMKLSTSKKKRKATEQMSTNTAPSLKKKRRSKQPSLGSLPVDKDKQPSPGSLPVDKDKQPSPGSLPVDKDKQPSLSKKMVRSPIMNNVVVSFLARRGKKAKAICHLLGAFYTTTNKISGRTYPTSHLYFYEVWNVKQVMEKEVLSENATIVAMVKGLEKKWTKYFEESFLTSCVPVIFDPRYKYEYVEFQLTSAFGGGAEIYLTKVKNAMKILFAEYASQFENISDEGDEIADEDGEDTLDDWDKHLRLKRSHNSNELQRYLEEELFPRRQKLDILKWWEIHSPKYPVLAAIARDILAVSASTVPVEAAFSNAGRVITDHRSSLSPSTVETLMCLEDWLRAADRQRMETADGDYGGDANI